MLYEIEFVHHRWTECVGFVDHRRAFVYEIQRHVGEKQKAIVPTDQLRFLGNDRDRLFQLLGLCWKLRDAKSRFVTVDSFRILARRLDQFLFCLVYCSR